MLIFENVSLLAINIEWLYPAPALTMNMLSKALIHPCGSDDDGGSSFPR
jgi:hypothetical protein